MDKDTDWSRTITYLNNLKPGTLFTRKDLFENVYKYDINNFKRLRRFENAVDHYRRYLCILKFIERVTIGRYKKIDQIPLMLSAALAQKICYGKDWKDWFIPSLKERIEVEANEKRTRTKTRKKVPKHI